jgi:hypothetical protein
MAGVTMKIYGVSTTRNGTITNANYNNLSYTGIDSSTGKQYHLWYPVEIPEGTNSLFTGVTTTVVDSIATPYSAGAENNSPSLLQERMILIHNDSNTPIGSVRVFIADQQLTGCVAEITLLQTLLLISVSSTPTSRLTTRAAHQNQKHSHPKKWS